ncbi:MAG: GNAT family acetyltransferase [Burkholderiales bacterium]|nr:GNAT family acetyltransferase [Burkholderiales bacterium]
MKPPVDEKKTKSDSSKPFIVVSSAVYLIISATLMIVSLALMTFAAWETIDRMLGGERIVIALLDAIKLIVIALAVFDVAKYLMEEEVLRDRELRSPTEARRSMTKFMVIICVVVSLEAVASIAQVSPENMRDLVYPAVLLLSAVAVMVGLGLYQKLSSEIETKEGEGRTAAVTRPR